MTLYTRADIQNNFDESDFNRGLDYYKAGKVVDAEMQGNGAVITGEVSGSRRYNYEQDIEITHYNRNVDIEGNCSCPVGYNCKHVAAVLFKVLDAPASKSSKDDPVRISLQVKDWLQKVDASLENNGDPNSYPDKLKNRLIFLLHPGEPGAYGIEKHPHFTFMNVRLTKHKGYGANPQKYNPENIFNYKIAAYLRPVDLEILREFHILKEVSVYWADNYFCPLPASSQGVRLLKKILSTGRCHFMSLEGPVLSEGPVREARLDWKMDASGMQRVNMSLAEDKNDNEILPLSPPFYVDQRDGICGPLDLGIPEDLAAMITSAPAVNAVEAAKITEVLAKITKKRKIRQSLPLPKTAVKAVSKKVKPVPCLELFQAEIKYNKSIFSGPDGRYSYYYHASYVPITVPLARLTFDYEVASLSHEDSADSIEQIKDDTLVTIPRDRYAEKRALNLLKKRGFRLTKDLSFFTATEKHGSDLYLMPDEFERLDFRAMRAEEFFQGQRFINFSAQDIPELEATGWRFSIADDYPYILAQGSIDWWADVKEKSGIDWFSFSLGVEFDGERINLLPTLLKMISMLPSVLVDIEEPEQWEDLIRAMFENQMVYHRLEDRRLLPLPGERVIPILMSLLELIGPISLLDMTDEGELRLKPVDAAGLAAFEEGSKTAQLAWKGQKRLVDLGNRLRNSKELPKVRLSKHLANTLRPYQKHGVNWLSFLRETGFGAVLADDMGLGKTLQVLSFIQTEKRRRRLNKPVLVISPTSVLPNWKAEIEKFAPSLSILVLHGPGRREKFLKIPEHDLILTTYPLLTRDKDVLLKHEYQIAVLDEAQVIKNAKANVSLAACALKSDCRIALTGTPIENNLDELWSLFSFVNPGFLGDQKSFRQNFRTPIEKHGNTNIQSCLSRKVKPFMLRRTKEQVALELPPKTEVIEHIELETGQRDLYETIRLVMDKKVRDAISVKGLHRSQIIVLDALLKLRQICCDPRLLKLDSAKKVKQSAKLNRLMEIIPGMVADGRRILLFSQFTSMLSLIEKELKRKKIDFVKITGNTKDRETPVKQFQTGKVPLFLISLKAGGTGLNLTAADTVIHYDPWWNPAVEKQATDRAHRIGQDKPVFVHKLIVSNGVEEAIQELKKKKAALAEAIFSENSSERFELTEDDLGALFAPMKQAA